MPISVSTGGRACACLKAIGLEGGYGANQVLFGIDIEVAAGEIVAVIGHNGAGKSTLLRCILGLLPHRLGNVLIEGERVDPVTPRTLGSRGVVFVPQGGGAFASLSVRENLLVAASVIDSGSRRRIHLWLRLQLFRFWRHC